MKKTRKALVMGLALARLLASVTWATTYYALVRLRLWARSQVYRARFRLALWRSGAPPELRREVYIIYKESLRRVRPPGVLGLFRGFKQRERG